VSGGRCWGGRTGWRGQRTSKLAALTGQATAHTVFLLGQALISGQAPTAAFGQPGVLRAVLGSGLYLAALGLLGVALGTLLRHPAAAIGVLVAVVLVLPGIAAALPARIESNVEEYWPTMAGAQVTAVIHGTHELGPWHPMPVEGVGGRAPPASELVRRSGTVTVQVWHPAACQPRRRTWQRLR
jgi:hypothetical protein